MSGMRATALVLGGGLTLFVTVMIAGVDGIGSAFVFATFVICVAALALIAIDSPGEFGASAYDRPYEDPVWATPPHMLTGYARSSWEKLRASAREHQRVATLPMAELVEHARLLITESGVWAEDEADLIRRCVSNRAECRRLYYFAARRLHPDRNEGRHRPEWTRIQLAVAAIRNHQGAGDIDHNG